MDPNLKAAGVPSPPVLRMCFHRAFSWQLQFRWSYTHANPCPGDKCVMEDDTGDSNQHFQLWSPSFYKQLPGGVCVTYKHKSNLAWGRQGLSQEIPVALCQVPPTYVLEAIQASLSAAGERQFPKQLSCRAGMFSAIQTGALYSVQVLLQLVFRERCETQASVQISLWSMCSFRRSAVQGVLSMYIQPWTAIKYEDTFSCVSFTVVMELLLKLSITSIKWSDLYRLLRKCVIIIWILKFILTLIALVKYSLKKSPKSLKIITFLKKVVWEWYFITTFVLFAHILNQVFESLAWPKKAVYFMHVPYLHFIIYLAVSFK